ncbi:ATP12 family chaperone protein [Paracraurococcus ruber]|uniref:Chaperone, ATP12 n=1 Tax=Paracraurococcus ruber TaxID=77675 RepID=A0ABS1D7K5_9PROT|nr:ATP12 family protein [Paracraurococcus ruber]MBK1662315.1 chaperone, ATP12 [Paracraurococcus ruber]TDG13037.1 chaperone, ATP12 [Paracraurococcus ruber]
MKRFWDTAAVEPEPGGFRVTLDGKPVRLPGGTPLQVGSAALAAAIAAEWDAAGGSKGGEMGPADIPLTRLAGTAQERIAPDPAPMVEGLARYAESDLLCYRAEDRRLAALQAAEWQPLLDWAALQHDAPLRVTAGLMPVPQDPPAVAALRRAVAAQDPIGLAVLGVLVPAFGSLVLGLAVVEGRLDAAEAHRLAILDETFQEEFWGLDAEAAERRRRVAAEVAVAGRLLALARAPAA